MQDNDRRRLEDLEVRLTHHDRTIAELNEIITEQWRKIDLLEMRLKQLREEMQNVSPSGPGDDRPPPHY